MKDLCIVLHLEFLVSHAILPWPPIRSNIENAGWAGVRKRSESERLKKCSSVPVQMWYQREIAKLAKNESDGDSRVLRGGSFDFNPQSLRSAYRDHLTPEGRFSSIGFRISRTP